jgi:sigma-B regulation protein RsbU (phosphoserine phosphatase)
MSAPNTARPARTRDRIRGYWNRVTEGAGLEQLWRQFTADARQSYAFYSRDVDWETIQGKKRWKRWFHITWALFHAMLMKLSPARRVLLLIAVVLVLYPVPSLLTVESGSAESFVVKLFGLGAALLFLLLALELADRVTMKRDLEIARDIQRWLVPGQPPAVPGAEVAFATLPANTVAGDYYDVLERPSKDGARWLIVVGDVAGKSIPAALLMATFQASLHTLIAVTETLFDLVTGLNRYACAHSDEGRRFTTAFFAEYEPGPRWLTYVNAGHNPAVLQRASGAIEYLSVGGLPLGIPMPNNKCDDYAGVSLQLFAGDTVVIFTDGLVEAMNAGGEEYGDQRLLSMLQSFHNESAARTLERLFEDVKRFVGETSRQDDITCLVFQCK